MWSDNETARDFLNFSGVADTVAEIIVQAQGRPISIGVSGAWGVGKSSMIKLTRESLEKRPRTYGDRDFIFVEFNAWLYQGYDDARAALMEVIASKLEDEAEKRRKGIEKVKSLLQRVDWLRAAKLTAGSALAISLGLPPVGLLGEAWQHGSKLFRGKADKADVEGSSKAGGELAAEVGGLLKPKREDSPPNQIQALRDSFESALEEMNVTIVVLIDDLDRCLPETTISTLEANQTLPEEESVVLLSGGLDSLIGAIDLVRSGKKPLAVSQIVRGDAEKQVLFAKRLGPLKHLGLNHNAIAPESQSSLSQRSRSLIFIAFGIAAATTLAKYHAGGDVPLYICENGFIAINPPLTPARLGSLSTRTAHPLFLGRIQELLDSCGLRIKLDNPHRYQTKGEMLSSCVDQPLTTELGSASTSCARFLRYSYRHCGRCMPCQIRRAAFLKWGVPDTTIYAFEDIGKNGPEHSGFDDVRSVAMALAEVSVDGLDAWIGSSLSRVLIPDAPQLKEVVGRGLKELEVLHRKYNVK